MTGLAKIAAFPIAKLGGRPLGSGVRRQGERGEIMGSRATTGGPATDRVAFLLRLLLGALFIAHLYWKLAILPGGLGTWWNNLLASGYPGFVPAYVLSAELAGALLLIPGVLTRYVALYAMPMMAGAAHFWLVRKGFYFTQAGAELPLVWLALLGLQVVAGDGAFALVKSPRLRRFLKGPA